MLFMILMSIIFLNNFNNKRMQYISYKDFDNEVKNGNINSVWIEEDIVEFSKNNDENL